MSSLYIPYITQKYFNHIYFAWIENDKDVDQYWKYATGLYPYDKADDDFSYSVIFELLLLFDEIYLNIEDYFYLLTKIDKGILRELIEEEVIKLIDTNSYRFGLTKQEHGTYFMKDDQPTTVGYSSIERKISGSFSRKIHRSTRRIQNEVLVDKVIRESNKDIDDIRFSSMLNLEDKTKVNDVLLSNYRMNRIFYMNFFYAIQVALNIETSYNDNVLFDLHKYKVNSHIEPEKGTLRDSFKEILNLSNVLDVNKAVRMNLLEAKDIIELRSSKNCIEFRKWLHSESLSIEDRDDVLRAYHADCMSRGKFESISASVPYKVLNIMISFATGLIPPLGIAYSVFDNFKDLVVKEYKPRFFIEDIGNRIQGH